MGLFSSFARRIGARPISRYSISAKHGANALPEGDAKSPKDMLIKSKKVKNLARKKRVAQRRNKARLSKGKPMRRYLASAQGVK